MPSPGMEDKYILSVVFIGFYRMSINSSIFFTNLRTGSINGNTSSSAKSKKSL